MHVDDRGIAFTRSGNWKEASKAPERGVRAKVEHVVRVVGMWLGLVLVGNYVVFYAMKGLSRGESVALLIPAAGMAYGIYRFAKKMKDDVSQSFRVPFSKVRSLRVDDGERVIAFINGQWKEDEVKARLPDAEATWVRAVWESERR